MVAHSPDNTVEKPVTHRGRRIGEFFFELVLWLLIGMLVQWIMPDSTHLALMSQTDGSEPSFWNALGLVALFFTVLAFLLRDFFGTKAAARGLSLVATRVLATTFDLGMFAFGGYLLTVILGQSSDMTLWQQLFFSNIIVFIISLVVLGALLLVLRCSHISLASLSVLEYKPLARFAIYIVALVALVLIALFLV
ncbi:hypothetical protein [Carnimonas nigrificans]|uniref:hypothetical protein n=1 Tax=Carnimonas nigrificans TaxID=64323 RepID=UPI0004720DD3|nr:hypothetical protein [Carnimonas nigrificans]